jgi:hypothetical protein
MMEKRENFAGCRVVPACFDAEGSLSDSRKKFYRIQILGDFCLPAHPDKSGSRDNNAVKLFGFQFFYPGIQVAPERVDF